MTTTIRPWNLESGEGRKDVDDVEWFACDPYPTWYRWVGDTLVTPKDGSCEPTWPETESQPTNGTEENA